MTKPSNFLVTTDYATLQNDDGGTTTVTAPGSASVTGSGSVEYHSDLAIGANASINRVQISSSKDSDTRYATQALYFQRSGTAGGSATSYNILAFVYRTSATNLRCQIYIPNPSSSTLTTASGNETFTFHVDTFIPPFNA